METSNKSIDNFNELVFENRHKEYGAYAIRKSYNDHVTRALLLTSSFFLLLAFTAIWFTKNKIEIPDIKINCPGIPPLSGREMDVTPPLQKKIEPIKPQLSPKTISGLMEASNDENKTVDKTNEQTNISKDPNPNGADSTSQQKEPYVPEVFVPEKKAEIVKVPDIMPELVNMERFISEHLHYPRGAVANGTEGIVYITFVVEPDGSISNVGLLKGIGDGCEEEAMRVVKIFPKWQPGVYEGRPARVQCNLPVKFRLK